MKKKWNFFILIIGFVLIIQPVFCQSSIEEEVYIQYNEDFARADFEKATQFEKSDSLSEAITFYKRVAKYNSANRIGKISKNKLDSIWLIEKEVFLNQLLGKWRWIWSGSNWGTGDSPKKCSCQKYLKFEMDQIIFYEDDVEKEKLAYDIIYDLNKIGTGRFMIKIEAADELWQLMISQEIDNSLFLRERSKDSEVFLNFRDIRILPNCVCGCPEKRFEKIKSKL